MYVMPNWLPEQYIFRFYMVQLVQLYKNDDGALAVLLLADSGICALLRHIDKFVFKVYFNNKNI